MKVLEYNQSFGAAVEHMRTGGFAARLGWNGKGMYLWLMPAAKIPLDWCKEPHLQKLAAENGGEIECLATIRMKTADNKVLTGWLASQSDIQATDWELLAFEE